MYYLDHIVHFVEKPEQMVEKTNEIGLHTVVGGKHSMWGTYNSLCYFGLSYIEFIGIYNEELFHKSAKEPYTLHQTYAKRNRKNGFNRIALRTNTIDHDAERLKKIGFTVYGPDSFSRTRPDGSVITWKLLHFGQHEQDMDYPFLIQWEGDDISRYEELEQLGTIKQHPLGNLKIIEISIEVKNIVIAETWARVFQYDIKKNENTATIFSPNCHFKFIQNEDAQNEITEVVIAGSTNDQEVILENAKYRFTT
nr:VOC family protein [Lysinibacillus timonensis]